jgi:2-C-methyl-D-erythritol 2,4-cyclodiphosphate synthase
MTEARVGLGVDLHARAPGKPLSLAGVPFEGEDGLAGHSDGDVVCHAVADAILGAAGLGDLGEHFPDTDPQLEGVGGLELLGRTVATAAAAGWAVASCDATLLADRPHIAASRALMRERLAAALEVPVERVSVKATRPEGLGLTGDGAGCLAIVQLVPRR